jgi:hypothetical protein
VITFWVNKVQSSYGDTCLDIAQKLNKAISKSLSRECRTVVTVMLYCTVASSKVDLESQSTHNRTQKNNNETTSKQYHCIQSSWFLNCLLSSSSFVSAQTIPLALVNHLDSSYPVILGKSKRYG